MSSLTEQLKSVNGRKHLKVILIILMLVVKIAIMGLFSSDYQDNMFIPFVNSFLSGENPYEYFYRNNFVQSFPYPPLMLLIESMGGLLLNIFAPAGYFVRNVLFKIPLLLFDYIGFLLLQKMGMKFKYAFVFYFVSPIIVYGTYVHSQLDIIPTVLLLAAVYYVTRWKSAYNLLIYSGLLGMSLAAKFHIIAAVPILSMYIIVKRGWLRAIESIICTAIVFFLFTLPFAGMGMLENVFMNKEQSVLFSIGINYGSAMVLLPVFALALLYLRLFELNYFNKDLLISLLALSFSIFLICIPPMPAWFIWIVPFIALYFGNLERNKYKVMFIYGVFNLMYIIYMPFFHQTRFVDIKFAGNSLQYLKIEDMSSKSTVFTLMIAALGMTMYNIFMFGISSNGLYRRGSTPFTIGIAGDSGSGKSMMLGKIQDLFGIDYDVLFLEGDGDHRWERTSEMWTKYTALDPKANYLYRQARNICELRKGNSVERSEYNHVIGKFTDKFRLKPKKYVVLCGLHALYLPQTRREIDLKIYMDTDEKLRRFWKIRRDVTERGYDVQEVITRIEERADDGKRYIDPQKNYADLIVSFFDDTLDDYTDISHIEKIGVKIDFDVNIDMDSVVDCFRKHDIQPEHILSYDLKKQSIIFKSDSGISNSIDYDEIAEEIIPQYNDLFSYTPKWRDKLDGIIQIFLLISISDRMKRKDIWS